MKLDQSKLQATQEEQDMLRACSRLLALYSSGEITCKELQEETRLLAEGKSRVQLSLPISGKTDELVTDG